MNMGSKNMEMQRTVNLVDSYLFKIRHCNDIHRMGKMVGHLMEVFTDPSGPPIVLIERQIDVR